MSSRTVLALLLASVSGCAADAARSERPRSILTAKPPPTVSAPPAASEAAVEPERVVDGFVSAYVVPMGPTEVALVDCGFDPEGKALLAALARRGLGPEAVKAILLTHAHADHLGGCHLFPNAEVAAFTPRRELTAASEKPLPRIRTLGSDEPLSLNGLEVRAYPVPGHTADGGVFLVGGALFLGDAGTATADGKGVKAAPWIFTGENKRRDEERRNVAALARLHQRLVADKAIVRKIFFAHSDPITDFDALSHAE
jgi:hydroxyacylglutathione hydrolase